MAHDSRQIPAGNPSNDAAAMTKALTMWLKLKDKPMGKWLFARAVCWKAPYFSTIAPRFEELKPGYARVSLKNQAIARSAQCYY